MSSGFISTGSSSVALELGKAFPNSNDKPCKVPLQCPPLGSRSCAALKLSSPQLEESSHTEDRKGRAGEGCPLSTVLLGSSVLLFQEANHPQPSLLPRWGCGAWRLEAQSLRRVWLFVTPWTAARQASLSITNSWRLEVSKLQPMDQIQHTTYFYKWSFIGTQPHSFVYILSMTAFIDSEDPDVGKDWGQEEKGTTEEEMAGWHHRLSGHEFE